MKKTKRGFTIVELVIVIAVIAILAAILIPVFANVTDNAKTASAKAEIKNAFSAYITAAALNNETYDEIDTYYFVDAENTIYQVEADGDLIIAPTGTTISGTSLGEFNNYNIYAITGTTTSTVAAG